MMPTLTFRTILCALLIGVAFAESPVKTLLIIDVNACGNDVDLCTAGDAATLQFYHDALADPGNANLNSFFVPMVDAMVAAINDGFATPDSDWLIYPPSIFGYGPDDTTGAAIFDSWAADGYEHIIWGGFSYDGAIVSHAAANPAMKNTIIDEALGPWTGFDATIHTNIQCAVFNEQQVTYVAGYAAGATTQMRNPEKTVGVVGPMPFPAPRRWQNGFPLGVRDACPECFIEYQWVYTFGYDQPSKDAAVAMVQKGADIVFTHGGATGNGVTAVPPLGKYIIGGDIDVYKYVYGAGSIEGADKVLLSATKNVRTAVFQTIVDDRNGKFVEYSESARAYDYTNGGLFVTDCYDACDYLPGGRPYMDEIRKQENLLGSGNVVVPVDPLTGNLDIWHWADAEWFDVNCTRLPVYSHPPPARMKGATGSLLEASGWPIDGNFNPYLYVFGGFNEDSEVLGDLWAYQYGDMYWNELKTTNGAVVDNGVWPEARASATLTPIPSLGKLVLFGGTAPQTGADLFFSDVYVLHDYSNWDGVVSWSASTTADDVEGRQGHSATQYNDVVYIFGGLRLDGTKTSELLSLKAEMSEIDGSFSHTFEEFDVSPKPPSRFEHIATVYKSDLYIYGGVGSTGAKMNDFWKINLDATSEGWVSLSAAPEHRRGMFGGTIQMSDVVGNWYFVIIGGESEEMAGNTRALKYDFVVEEWSYHDVILGNVGDPVEVERVGASAMVGKPIGNSSQIWFWGGKSAQFHDDTVVYHFSSPRIVAECGPGTFIQKVSATGLDLPPEQWECEACAPDHYKSGTNDRDSCDTCPEFSTTYITPSGLDYRVLDPASAYQNARSATSLHLCACATGYVGDVTNPLINGGQCTMCSEAGAECAGGLSLDVKEGFFKARDSFDVVQCPRRDSCLSGVNLFYNVSSEDSFLCVEGTQKTLCGVCAQEYFSLSESSSCQECPDQGLSLFVFVVVTLIVLSFIGLLFYKPAIVESNPTIGILLGLVQALNLLSTYDVNDWPVLRKSGGSVGFVNLDLVSALSPSCSLDSPTGYRESQMFSLLFIPVIFVVFSALIMAKVPSAFSIMFYVVLLAYPKAAATFFSVFNCIDVSDESYLVSDLAVNCNSAEYDSLLIVSVVGITLIAVGIPFGVVMTILYDKREKPMFQFLQVGLKDEYKYFDIVRRIFLVGLAIVPSIVSPDDEVPKQLYYALWLSVTFLVFQLITSPYASVRNSVLMTMSNMVVLCTILAGIGIHLSVAEADEAAVDGILVFVDFGTAAYILFVGIMFLIVMRRKPDMYKYLLQSKLYKSILLLDAEDEV